MWINLQIGILEEFAEAQQRGVRSKRFMHKEFSGDSGFCIIDPAKKLVQHAVWRACNPKKWIEHVKTWKQRNPEKVAAQKARRYQKQKEAKS